MTARRQLDTKSVAGLIDQLGSPPAASSPVPEGQPVHTVYVGADRFTHDLAPRWGASAVRVLDAYGGRDGDFASALGLPAEGALAAHIRERVAARLAREPVEDCRLDFEDGYGVRPDAEEDGHARDAARALARAHAEGLLPRSYGLRIKALEPGTAERALATLDRFVGELLEACGELPGRCVVTLPKVTSIKQVGVLCDALDLLEQRAGLPAGSLRVELMVESVATLFDGKGRLLLPRLVGAARGRCDGAHLGTFDFTLSCGVAALHQHLSHPLCELARQLMIVGLSGRGVWLCDGSTHVLPVEPFPDGRLSDSQHGKNRDAVHAGWRLHAEHVRNALVLGIPQGWDLHPHQLPARFGALAWFYAGPSLDDGGRVAADAVQGDAATEEAQRLFMQRGRSTGFG